MQSTSSSCASSKRVAPQRDGWALVMMTRQPYRFEEWLNYYRKLGVEHMFIAVEDSPDVDALLAQAPWCDMVTTHLAPPPESNPYETVITRQERVMEWALAECEGLGIPWLFHLDDDELLHFGESWESIVSQVPPDATCLVVSNVEGVPDDERSDFTTITRFAIGDENGWPMLAYANGKSAGRVGACSPHGPHRFTGLEWELPLDSACVLHFESCPYSRWEAKFTHYARTTSRLSKIPFDFYKDSIRCCREHSQEPSKLRSFWRRRKMKHYRREAEMVVTLDHVGLSRERRERLQRQRQRQERPGRMRYGLGGL